MRSGTVLSKGSRDAVPIAQLTLLDGGTLLAETDGEGHFSFELPPGPIRLQVSASGHVAKVFDETIVSGERVEVVYRLERSFARPYETVVRGQADRAELSRTTLDGAELREAAGTGGQPFRTVMLLPGVVTAASGLSYPVVRGSVPAATGFFFDGVRMPQLYHLLIGNSVIHPDFIDSLSFFPSNVPLRYGRLSGGLISAQAAPSRNDRLHFSVSADVLQANAFLDVPIAESGTRITVAGSANYAGLLLGAIAAAGAFTDFTPVLQSYDYQARVEQKIGRGNLRVLAFGSDDVAGLRGDELGSRPTLLGATRFHRVDLRGQHPVGPGLLEVGANVGWETMAFGVGRGAQSARFQLDRFTTTARASYRVELGQHLQLKAGFDAERQESEVTNTLGLAPGGDTLRQPRVNGVFTGTFLEATFFTERWTVVGGVRLDTWHLPPSLTLVSADPRVEVRFKPIESLMLRASAGLAHQAPMLLVSLPISDTAALKDGLQEVGQVSLGAVGTLPWLGLEVSGEVFYNHLFQVRERSLLEFSTGLSSLDDRSTSARWGRAYGLELMVRLPQQGRLFGWLTYTLMRSERMRRFAVYDDDQTVLADATELLPFAFDQAHTLNATLGYQLPKGFKVSASFHLHTGRPESGEFGSRTSRLVDGNWFPVPLNQVDRLPPFARLDLRASKTISFASVSTEFYLDVQNILVRPEIHGFEYLRDGEKREVSIPLVLPTIGVKVTY